jgi:hypothetical protein
MDHRVIGERSDAVLRTAMPGGDEGGMALLHPAPRFSAGAGDHPKGGGGGVRRWGCGAEAVCDEELPSAPQSAPSTTLLRSAVPLPRCAGQDGDLPRGPVVAGLRTFGGIVAPSGDVALRAGGERKPKRNRGNDGHDKSYAPIAITAHFRHHPHTPYTQACPQHIIMACDCDLLAAPPDNETNGNALRP